MTFFCAGRGLTSGNTLALCDGAGSRAGVESLICTLRRPTHAIICAASLAQRSPHKNRLLHYYRLLTL